MELSDDKKEVLGSGAFSVVYKHKLNGIPYAIKYADTKENSRRYIKHEVKILKALKGANHSVQMHSYRISRNGYIMYEMLSDSLYEIQKNLSIDEIKDIACQLLKAIREMHSRGVIHCDLKPENIMFTSNKILKIIDFGNALFADELITSTNAIGTLYYRPPEYIIGAPLNYKVDYWAYGCIIMELLIGREIFYPKRDNYVNLHASMIGQMILLFGNFSKNFINSGKYSYKYFDMRNDNTYLFKYLLGSPTTLYKILRQTGYSKIEATEWSEFLEPFFKRI